jgi:hypothetical protein
LVQSFETKTHKVRPFDETPIDAFQSTISDYVLLDFDTEQEFMAFFSTFRNKLHDMITFLSLEKPDLILEFLCMKLQSVLQNNSINI